MRKDCLLSNTKVNSEVHTQRFSVASQNCEWQFWLATEKRCVCLPLVLLSLDLFPKLVPEAKMSPLSHLSAFTCYFIIYVLTLLSELGISSKYTMYRGNI